MLDLVLAAAIVLQPSTFQLTPEAKKWIDSVAVERSDKVPGSSIFGKAQHTGHMVPAYTNDTLTLGVCMRADPDPRGWTMTCGCKGMGEDKQSIIEPLSVTIVRELSERLPGWSKTGWTLDHDGWPSQKAEKYTFTSPTCDEIFVRRFITPSTPYIPSNGAVELAVWMAPNPSCLADRH